jgi:chromosome segregation ATPase
MGIKPPREDSAHEIGNLSNTLASFGTTTGATTHALQQMLERASAINEILTNIGASDLRQTVNELASGVSALVKMIPQFADSQIQFANTVSVLTRSIADLRAEFQGTRAQLATLNKALAQSAAHAEETRRSLASLEERVAGNSTACRDLSTRLATGDQRVSDLSGSIAKLQEEVSTLGSIMRQLKLTVAAVRPRQYRWWHGFGFWRRNQPEN